jgi:hypothetical protein
MIALVRKELRELALPAVALVLCALALAGLDLLYKRYYPRYHEENIALSIWLVLAVALAFLGGGAAIARESRQRLIFLTVWPQSRAWLWLVKGLVSFLLTMAVIAAGFGLCLAGLHLEHSAGPRDVGEAIRALSWLLPLCFALGLMWSGLIGSVLGAGALGFTTGCLLLGGGAGIFALYLPKYWGPYVGTLAQVDWTQYTILPALLAIILFAGAAAFIRLPVLETRRRVLWALGLLLGLSLLGSTLFAGWAVASRSPALRRAARAAGLTPDGRSICFTTDGTKADPGGLWLASLDGAKPRLLCRAGGSQMASPALLSDAIVLRWDLLTPTYWAVTAPEGKPRRLRGEPGACSPDGRYWATTESPGELVIRDAKGHVVRGVDNDYGLVFSPDNCAAYYPLHDGRLLALDLATGRTGNLLQASAGESLIPLDISPDGQWLALVQTREKRYKDYSLLNVETRKLLPLGELSPFPRHPFVTERYLWCQQRAPQTRKIEAVVVVDTQTGRVVNRLGVSTLQSAPSLVLSRPGVPYVIPTALAAEHSADPNAPSPPRKLWLADLDGSRLRFLHDETREVLGMAADGHLILWDRPNVVQWSLAMSKDSRLGRHFVSWDPLTGEEKTLLTLPDSGAQVMAPEVFHRLSPLSRSPAAGGGRERE